MKYLKLSYIFHSQFQIKTTKISKNNHFHNKQTKYCSLIFNYMYMWYCNLHIIIYDVQVYTWAIVIVWYMYMCSWIYRFTFAIRHHAWPLTFWGSFLPVSRCIWYNLRYHGNDQYQSLRNSAVLADVTS